MDLKGGNGPFFQRLLVPVMQIEYACDTQGEAVLPRVQVRVSDEG